MLLLDTCRELKKHHSITVVYLYDRTELVNEFTSMGIETIFLDFKKLDIIRTMYRLSKVIKYIHPNIIHMHLPSADTVGRLTSLLFSNVKLLSTIHNCDPWKLEKNPTSVILRLFNRFTVNTFKRVKLIAVSESVKEFCIQHEHINPHKITTLYNFVDYNNPIKREPGFDFPFAGDSFKLVITARLVPQKMHITLFKAVDILVNQRGMNDLILLVLGGGEDRVIKKQLTDFIRDHKLSAHIHMLGMRFNVYDYLIHSDVYIMPSAHEGLGISTLEAFYNRIPVILYDITVHREITADGMRGVLFKEGSAHDLADKIEAIRRGEYPLDEQIQNAYDFCKELTVKNYTEKLEEIMRG